MEEEVIYEEGDENLQLIDMLEELILEILKLTRKLRRLLAQ